MTKIFLTLALSFLFFFFHQEPVYAVNAPLHLKYFGYFAVNCSLEGTKEDISSLAALNNSNVMFLFNVQKECLDLVKKNNIKILAWPGPYIFEGAGPGPRRGSTHLKANWQEGWERFKNDIKGFEDVIYAFYFEEPWWYGISEGDILTITNKMKQDFPNIGRFAIEAGVSLTADLKTKNPTQIPKVYKRYYQNFTDLGVDVYGDASHNFSDWNRIFYSWFFDELYNALSVSDQKIWVIPQAYWMDDHPNFTRLTEIFNTYYNNFASPYPRVMGILNFLYSPSPCCGHSVKEFTDPTSPVYNEQYRILHLDTGRAILLNNPTPTGVPTPTATPRPTSTPSGGPTPTLTPTPPACIPSNGNANEDEKATLVDFEIWREEFFDPAKGKRADFNCDSKVDLFDFEIWRRSLYANL